AAYPSGMVRFIDVTTGTTLGQAPVTTTSGVASASFPTSMLSVGSHTVTATYNADNGDGNFTQSSDTRTLTVDPAGPPIITWVNAAGGDWDTPSNWSGDFVPTAADDVAIHFAGIQVTHDVAQADAVHSLTSQAFVSLSAGSLALGGPSILNAAVIISG